MSVLDDFNFEGDCEWRVDYDAPVYKREFTPFSGKSSLIDDQQYCYGKPGKPIQWLSKNIYFAKKDFNINNENEKEKCKMAKRAKRTGTKVLTGKVRLSYCHLFQPYAMEENQEPKYSVSVIIPKTEKETIKAIKEAIKEAAEQGKSKFKGGKLPANLKTPLRDGDIDRPDDDAYRGCYFINANSKLKPGVVDADCIEVMDASEVYSGCYGRVTINFYAFNVSGNQGVAAGLGNVQKLEEGEPLGGITSAAADFEDEDDEDLLE